MRLDPEDTRRLGCPESGGLAHSERDRELSDDLTGQPLADHALQAVDEPDHLDPTLDHAEQCLLIPLVYDELAGADRDVGRNTTEPLAAGPIEHPEHLELEDLLRRHHARHRGRAEQTAPGMREALTSTVTT